MAKFIDLTIQNQKLGKIKVFDNKQASIVFSTPIVEAPLVNRICSNLERSMGVMKLKGVSFAEGVKKISDEAFKNRNIQTVKIRSSVLESIGKSAFENCGIKKLDLDWKNFYRKDREALVDENFGLRRIGDRAFANNDVSALDVPPTVEHLGIYAFSYNDKLRETIMSEELVVPSSTFYDSMANVFVYIPPVFKRRTIEPKRRFKVSPKTK